MGTFWFMTLQPQLILLCTAWTILCFPSREPSRGQLKSPPLHLLLHHPQYPIYHQISSVYLLKMFLEFMFLSYLYWHHLIQTITSHMDHTLSSWSTCNYPLADPFSTLKQECFFQHTVCFALLVGWRQWPATGLWSLAPTYLSNLVSYHPLPQSTHWPHWPFNLPYLPCSFSCWVVSTGCSFCKMLLRSFSALWILCIH